ncbi:MAG: tail tubular protein [Siphoviridae sp. ctdEk19]|nr:MAG: tail tubular protein [Siphoviridae sp. ctdEk19]
MTLLEVIQQVAMRAGVPKPLAVFSSLDEQVLQMAALLNESLDDLVSRFAWKALRKEATFTTTAVEDQGAMTTLAPYGYLEIVNDTFYDRTSKLEIAGPLTAQQWQGLKSIPLTGPVPMFRIVGGRLKLIPVPAAGLTYAFEYDSDYAVLASDGTTYKGQFSADNDTCVLPERLLRLDLKWRWKKEKGLSYAEDQRMAEEAINNAKAKDGGRARLSMGAGQAEMRPAIVVPAGSWSLP